MPFTQTGSNAQANIGTYVDVAGNQTNYTINQTTDVKELKKESKKDRLIESFPRAHANLKDYQTSKKGGPCFEGTRVSLLGEIKDWVTSPGESKMYALSGLAGIGKSTVAYTVATWADELGLLGASFFFSRDDADRRTAKKFFTTLAYQLCLYKEGFAQAIGEVLVTERGSKATTETPQEQLEALILEPLRAIAASSVQPILVVVDALDECDSEDVPFVLAGLRQMVQDLVSFKIILTTRPKPLVSHDFATLSGHKIFHLQDIEDKVVSHDIQVYLKHSLSREQVKAHLQDPTEQWNASDREIETLVHAAGKLFIIASTAVRFILDKHWGDPADRMETLLRAFAQNSTPLDYLSHFYTTILRSAVPADCRDERLVRRYQIVVGTIVLVQVPLSVNALASFTNIKEKQILVVLRQLQSVIQVGTDNIPIIYHKSFPDYITDSTLCQDINLRIDPTDRHTWIATRCLETMNKRLKYNILGLDSPARFMDNKKGLAHQGISEGQLQEKLPTGLRYACVYWANHSGTANTEDTCLIKGLEKFADSNMLNWFEALSLIGKLDFAHRSIRVVLRLVIKKPNSSTLFQLLSDGLRFISKFYDIIRESALHTYYSALPFTPTESLLYRRYSEQAADSICRVIGAPKQWDALIACPSCGPLALDAKFSLDSTMIAVWGGLGQVKILDAVTGTPVSTISLDHDEVAIANDFSTVASVKDSTITLYSVKSDTHIATFTTSTEIESLALTSEGSRVAAALADGTLCLWDTGKSQIIASFGVFDTQWAILAFSLTGSRLVFSPRGRSIIQLRDGINGELIASLDHPSVEVLELVFSHDGSRFATLTSGAMRLWEIESGELVGSTTTRLWDEYCSLAISADGSLLAIGHIYKVQFWSANNGNPLALSDELVIPYDYHRETFSSQDTVAIAGSEEIMLYDVRNRSVISTLPIFSPRSLTFSLDCTRLAAMNHHGEIHLWDVQSIKASSSPSKKQARRVRTLTLSPDCSRLACRFEDNAIEIWQVGPTVRRTPVHDGGSGAKVFSIRFSPDGRQFAACLGDRTIGLWSSEDGASIGSVKCARDVQDMALSNRILAFSDELYVALWDLRTLHPIGTVKGSPERLWFSNDGDLLASYHVAFQVVRSVEVLDVIKRTEIATFSICGNVTEVAFSPDNSQLVAQLNDDSFKSFNLVSQAVTSEPTLNHLVQLRHFLLGHGIPVYMSQEHSCLSGSFSQNDCSVPVLRIPRALRAFTWACERSMIALACADGQVIFVQLPCSDVR